MALTAEYYMVENQSIQALMAARQKEIDYITVYMNSMSLTAALFVNTVMGGTYSGMVQAYTKDTSNWADKKWMNNDDYSLTQNYSFWVLILLVSSVVCAMAGVHCILFATYIVMWTHRMTLLGPAGSVARALASVKSLQGHVKFSFFLMLGAFTVNCVSAFWLCDLGQASRASITSLYVVGSIITVFSLRYVYIKHFRYSHFYTENTGSPYAGRGTLSRRLSTTGPIPQIRADGANRVDESLLKGLANSNDYFGVERKILKEENKIFINARHNHKQVDEKFREELRKDAERWNNNGRMEGMLGKRSVKGVIGFQERYFILEGHEFCYYKTKDQALNQETPEKGTIFSLDGYEVVVGSDSFAGLFDFSLVPIPGGVAAKKRTWGLRCKDEGERVKWVRAFLQATLSRNDEHIDFRQGRDTFVGDAKAEENPEPKKLRTLGSMKWVRNAFTLPSRTHGTTQQKKAVAFGASENPLQDQGRTKARSESIHNNL